MIGKFGSSLNKCRPEPFLSFQCKCSNTLASPNLLHPILVVEEKELAANESVLLRFHHFFCTLLLSWDGFVESLEWVDWGSVLDPIVLQGFSLSVRILASSRYEGRLRSSIAVPRDLEQSETAKQQPSYQYQTKLNVLTVFYR